LPFFVKDSLSCALKYQKGFYALHSICKYYKLHSTLPFFLATTSGPGPHSVFSFCLAGGPFRAETKFQGGLGHVGNVNQILRINNAVLRKDLFHLNCHSANIPVKLLNVNTQALWMALGNISRPSKRYVITDLESSKPMIRNFEVSIRVFFLHYFFASVSEPPLFDFDTFTS